jgi:hypothetical protein
MPELSGLPAVSVVGIFALMVIREILSWTLGHRPGKDADVQASIHSMLKDIQAKVRDLWHWHAPNPDGKQSWKDMDPLLERLDRLIELQEKMLER